MHDLWDIERKICGQLQGLDFRLLQFPGNRQLVAFGLRGQIETRGLYLGQILAPQIAHLHVESCV